MYETPLSTFSDVDFHAGRLFSTHDLDEARVLCGRVFNPHDLKVTGAATQFRSQMDHLRIGDLSLNRLSWGAAVHVDPDQLQTYYLISMPIQGQAQFCMDGVRTQVSPRCMGVVNASQRFHFDATEGFTQIALRIERQAVDAGWQALSGQAPETPIDFDCGIDTSSSTWQALAPVMRTLGLAANNQKVGTNAHFLHAKLEELVVMTLLLNQNHSHGAQLWHPAKTIKPGHVKRAELYMQERLGQALTVSEVARASHVSVRSLQAAFQQAHGCGPMAWLRKQRLLAVRQALGTASNQHCTVADTALRFGFTHLGEFSKAYVQSFGETARTTLARCG